MSTWNYLILYCFGCDHPCCTAMCFATHRHIFGCHNPNCVFHMPSPVPPMPPEPSDPSAALPAPSPMIEQAQAQAAITSTDDADDAEETAAATSEVTSEDADVVCRETIIREWRRVEGGSAPTTGQTAAVAPATTLAINSSATESTAPAGDSPSSAHVDRPSTPPARFTIEEYEAQAQLLAQYQQPQGSQPQEASRNDRAGRNGSVRGASPRTTVRIQFN